MSYRAVHKLSTGRGWSFSGNAHRENLKWIQPDRLTIIGRDPIMQRLLCGFIHKLLEYPLNSPGG